MPRRKDYYIYPTYNFDHYEINNVLGISPNSSNGSIKKLNEYFGGERKELWGKDFEETGLPAIVVSKKTNIEPARFFHLCSPSKEQRQYGLAAYTPKGSAGVLVRRGNRTSKERPRYWCNYCGKTTSKHETNVLDFMRLPNA